MKLIFINKVGESFDGEMSYEFIFSRSVEEADGEDWDSSNPEGPDKECVHYILQTKSENLSLTLMTDLNIFTMYEAMDGVIALGWEEIDDLEEDEGRLVFKFNEDVTAVTKKLKSKGINFKTIEVS